MLVKFYHKPYSDLMQIEAANSLWNGWKFHPLCHQYLAASLSFKGSLKTHTEDVTKCDTFRGFNTRIHTQLTGIWGTVITAIRFKGEWGCLQQIIPKNCHPSLPSVTGIFL